MNTTDLLKKVYKTLNETGLLSEITEHVKKNPQLFEKLTTTTKTGQLITSVGIDIAYIVPDYYNMSAAMPDIYIHAGQVSTVMYEFDTWTYPKRCNVQQSTWVAGDKVTELWEAIDAVND